MTLVLGSVILCSILVLGWWCKLKYGFFFSFFFFFFHGLQLAFELKTNQIYVDSDSGVLVDLIQNENVALHLLGTLIENCRYLMESW